MERITLEIQNPGDVDLLLSFAKRIGVTVVEEERVIETSELAHSRSIIEGGCDISSYGNPVMWQKKIRKDRKMPFRDI